jgi:hypothetical protein
MRHSAYDLYVRYIRIQKDTVEVEDAPTLNIEIRSDDAR